jgi:S-adenosylmethionine hydrolase
MARAVVTLTTDFGTTDTFVGAMKGVILSRNPDAVIVDLTHDVPPQSVTTGAYLLDTAYRNFPLDSVHVVVVDPGVGTARRPIAVQGPSATFVCPDNGLLSYVLEREGGEPPDGPSLVQGEVGLLAGWAAYHLTNPAYWQHPVSETFHGRDIFASVAGHLSMGTPAAAMGGIVTHVQAFAVPRAVVRDGSIEGSVVHVDRFGNLVTNITTSLVPASGDIVVETEGRSIMVLSHSYQGTGHGAGPLVAVVGSNGTLEIAVRDGSASAELGVGVGGSVVVRTR